MTAEEVRRLRALLGFTQEAFAALVGVSPSLVSKWEAGTRTVQGPALVLLEAELEKAERRAREWARRRGLDSKGALL